MIIPYTAHHETHLFLSPTINTTPLKFSSLTEYRLMLTKVTDDNGQVANTGLWWDESRQMHTSMIFASNAKWTFCAASYSDDTKVGRAGPPCH